MKNKVIVVLLLIPILVHSYFYSNNSKISSESISFKDYSFDIESFDSKKVSLLDDDKIVEIDLEDYVVGVVACEMPASFEEEALKAMSVAARTFALYKMNGDNKYDLSSTTSDQCYITVDEMKEKWGSGFDKYYSKIDNAVSDTYNEYMTYNGEVIIAFYFSISNGKTENVKDVFSEDLDYLVSVDSSWDEEYSYKEEEVIFDTETFFDKLGLKDEKIKTITITRTDSGRVDYIVVNGTKFKGTDFRTKLGLKSTDFEISYGKEVKIKTKGYGHGVGMSQYGAEAMAKKGKSYKEILKHYYTGVEIMHN